MGDPFDILGGFGHLNGPHLEALGWLNNSNIRTINNIGTNPQIFVLKPIEGITDDLKVLKIKSDINNFMYLEFRQPIAFNQTIGLDSDVFSGALLHLVLPNEDSSHPYLIDASADSSTIVNFRNVALGVGKDLIDPLSGIKIKVTRITFSPDELILELSKNLI